MSKKQTLARTAQSPPKKYSLKLGKIISFLLILPLIFTSASGFLSSPVLAANFNINGSDSSAKTVNTGQQLSISVNPDTSFSDVIIDLEVYDANGSKIFQQAFEHQNLVANQAANFQANWTPNSTGKYQVKVGVFNNNWSQNYYWQDSVFSIDIGNQSQTQTIPGSFNVSVNLPQNPSVNTSLKISGQVTSPNNISDAIIDLEVYDANGSKIFQQFFDHQNLTANQAQSFTANWTPNSTGTYQVKVGVFNNNWSQKYYWQDNTGTIDVGNNQPQPTTQPSSDNFNVSLNLPSNPSANQSLAINGQVTSPNNISDAIVDLEVYDANGSKIFQQAFEHQNLVANQAANFQANWTPNSTGKYQVKVGVFNNNWSQNYYWQGNAGTIDLTNDSSPISTPAPAPISNNSGSGANYTIGADGRIYKNGQKIALHGVSWFGAEGGAHAPHGLWSRNWKDMITQMKSVGFNAVRLPYCPGTLRNVDTSTIDYGLNPDLKGLKSLDLMDKIVNELNNQQMYIQLDDHNPDCNAQSDLWYTGSYTENQWVQDQAFLADRYKNLEYFIGLDIKNEPKGSATWGTGNAATDWNTAAEKAGKAALSANPNILIFVQGIENNPTCSDNSLGHWWGGNLEPEKCTPINSDYIPANKLDFTPHVYGPDVFNQGYFNTGSFPSNMPAIWDKSFGFLKDQNKAVTIGEYGGKFGHGGDPKDPTWQKAFMNYLSSKGICDNFYWSWNPNSGDTGGVLQDDWTNVWQDKVDLLHLYQNQCK